MATGICASSCGEVNLIANPDANCVTDIRQKTISRLFFFPCSTDLPNPIAGGIKALFDNNTIVASSRLANVVVNDPVTQDVIIDECSPAKRIISTREITAEDRIAIALNTGSPLTTNKFADYDFWADKQEHQLTMNYMIAYCDGDVVIPKSKSGQLLTATMLAYLSWEKPQNQGGAWIEFKKLSIVFQGDPLALYNKPAFNYIDLGITL